MKINQKNTIENDIVGIDISVEVLGTADLTSEQELELLHNYNKMIEFNKIKFAGNMKMENNVPVVTDDPVDGTNVVEVVIPDVINEQFIVDEDLHITFCRDVTKFPESELNDVFSNREMLGQARVVSSSLIRHIIKYTGFLSRFYYFKIDYQREGEVNYYGILGTRNR